MLEHIKRLADRANNVFPTIPPPPKVESDTTLLKRLSSPGLVSAYSTRAIGWVPSSTIPEVDSKVLSADPAEGRFTSIVRVHPGGTIPARQRQVAIDMYVLSGSLEIGGERLTEGYYCRVEADESLVVTSETGCEFLAMGFERDRAE